MTLQQKRSIQARADIFKALGHPARLTMIMALSEGEKCVCELQDLVGSDMSTISKHLSVLRNAGLVDAEKHGKQVFYSLRLKCTVGFLRCVERAIEERVA